MKGLLIKEFDQFRTNGSLWYMAISVLFLISAAFYAVRGGINTTMMMLPFLLIGSIGVANALEDSKSRWSFYVRTLPFSRRDEVNAKYVFVLCAVLIQAAVYVILTLICGLAGSRFLGEVFPSAAALVAAGLVSNTVTMPIIYRFGADKARLVFALIMMAVGGLVGGMMSVVSARENDGDIMNFTTAQALGGFCVMALLYGLSWVISVSLHEKYDS